MSSIQNTNTGNTEWMTPPHIIEKVRTVMGSIDCDPATFLTAQQFVKANIYYTKKMNSMSKQANWKGNVWLNPPYNIGSKTAPGINHFALKLIDEISNGNCTQAIFLAQSKTDTQWFQQLFTFMNGVMFTKKRISFIDTQGNTQSSPGFGSVFMYYGNNLSNFHNKFSDIAYTVK